MPDPGPAGRQAASQGSTAGARWLTPALPFSLGFLLVPGFSNLALAAALEPLRAANTLTGQALYRWPLFSPDGAAVETSSGLAIPTDGPLTASPGSLQALLVIASYGAENHTSAPLLACLRRLSVHGIAVGAVESGALVLARAGLLDGYRVTTHWQDLDALAEQFPRVDTVPDRFVIDRDRVTIGGAAAALDFSLHLIARHHGLDLALAVGSQFLYEQEHLPDDPQRIVALGRLAPRHPMIAQAVRLMEGAVEIPLSIAEIARRVGTERRDLERQFQRVLATSPGRFYRTLRLRIAGRMLALTDRSVGDVAIACGFSSASSLARAMRRQAGRSPRELRGSG